MKNKKHPKILWLSAMNENGGNVTHRLLDGHPALSVYPFESQFGTRYVSDHLSSVFQTKYRWPVVPLGTFPEEIYEMIIDQELKTRVRTPAASKFQSRTFDLDESVRKEAFVAYLMEHGVDIKTIVTAMCNATFKSWENCRLNLSGIFVGFSPMSIVDGQKIIADFGPDIHLLHIIRNPLSGYSDTKKRPVPMSIYTYMDGWLLCQQRARALKDLYPNQVTIVRFEDILRSPVDTLSELCNKLQIKTHLSLTNPSFNNEIITSVYPWGVVEPDAKPKLTLSSQETKLICSLAGDHMIEHDYLPN